MKSILLTLITIASFVSPALAGEKIKLTLREQIDMNAALQQLDAHDQVVITNGVNTIAKLPYTFTGKVRMVIAHDEKILADNIAAYDKARQGLIKQLAGGGNEVPKEKQGEFFTQLAAMLDESQEQELSKLTYADLNLDANPVPPSVLAALTKIMVLPDPAP